MSIVENNMELLTEYISAGADPNMADYRQVAHFRKSAVRGSKSVRAGRELRFSVRIEPLGIACLDEWNGQMVEVTANFPWMNLNLQG